MLNAEIGLFLAPFLFLGVAAESIDRYLNSPIFRNTFFLLITGVWAALFVFSLIVAITTLPKHVCYLKAEQKVYFDGDLFCFESGKNLFEIEKKYLSAVKETKRFYIIHLAIIKSDPEWKDLLMFPYIPRRAVPKEEMRRLALQLNIPYKGSEK